MISPSLLGSETVNGLIVRNGSLSSLETALGVAAGDLTGTLNGTEAYTVFAPNDNAFSALADLAGYESTNDMLAKIDPAMLAEILKYRGNR